MRKAREILRLRYEPGLSVREIGRSLGISTGVVQNYLQGAQRAGLGWPLPEGLAEEGLHALLFPPGHEDDPLSVRQRALPAMAEVHTELKSGKYVTLQLLWEEYRRDQPGGYSYPQFCRYYRAWAKTTDPTIRQVYRAGEKMFVDWAGPTIPVTDPTTGQIWQTNLFVATLGCSNYTYAEAFAHRQLPSWIDGHVHSYEYFQGVPVLTVADNEKTGTTYPSRYEPGLNRTYQELGEWYQTALLPTRPRSPRDKAKVESAVLLAERWIIAALRHRTFFSLGELNQAIRELLSRLNGRAFKKFSGSRRELFEQLDRPALRPLPSTRYEMAEWRKAKVNIDYHVQVDNHLYSVPYRLVGAIVDVRLASRTVELIHNGVRVAAHPRSDRRGGATTNPGHRPKSHQAHLDWTPSRLIEWARVQVGDQCSEAVRRIMEHMPHPEQGYRSCLGLMRLGRIYGKVRLEQACARAILADACSYRSVKSILETGLDRQPLPQEGAMPVILHPNVRGAEYYQEHQPEEAVC